MTKRDTDGEALRRVASLEAEVRKLASQIERIAKPVRISCYTNIDTFRTVEWPTVATYAPRLGERVEGRGGGPDGRGGCLRVIGVTHVTHDGEPYLRLELHR